MEKEVTPRPPAPCSLAPGLPLSITGLFGALIGAIQDAMRIFTN